MYRLSWPLRCFTCAWFVSTVSAPAGSIQDTVSATGAPEEPEPAEHRHEVGLVHQRRLGRWHPHVEVVVRDPGAEPGSGGPHGDDDLALVELGEPAHGHVPARGRPGGVAMGVGVRPGRRVALAVVPGR